MLTALLTSLQGAVAQPRRFVIASLLPASVFSLMSVWLALIHRPAVSSAIDHLTGTATAIWSAIAVASVLVIALMLSAFSGTLLQALEGDYLPTALRAIFHRCQWERWSRLDDKFTASSLALGALQKADWPLGLAAADEESATRATCEIPGSAARFWITTFRRDKRAWVKASRLCRRLVLRSTLGLSIDPEQLAAAAGLLREVLLNNSAALPTEPSRFLQSLHSQLLDCFSYALNQYEHTRIVVANAQQFNFPAGVGVTAPGRVGSSPKASVTAYRLLAPTKMGNIGRTVQSYGMTRYSLDVDVFWSRLQQVVQASAADFYATIQDAKAQLDCFVAFWWLTLIFTAGWSVTLLIGGSHPRYFLAVSLAGPFLVVGFYRLAANSYRVFADLLRSAIDIYRFNLLKALHVSLPSGSEEESDLWNVLANRAGFGRSLPQRYVHPQP